MRYGILPKSFTENPKPKFPFERPGDPRSPASSRHAAGLQGTSLIDGGWTGAEEADQLAGSGAALSIGHEQNIPAGEARHRALSVSGRHTSGTESLRSSKKKKVGIEHREPGKEHADGFESRGADGWQRV